MFHYFIGVARRYGEKILDGEPVPLAGRLLYGLGDMLVYGPLKNMLGFSRIRVAYTAGEAIGPEIFPFYRSLGINLKQLYGQTEAFLYVTVQPDGEISADTVGPPSPNVEISIADNGEVLFRRPACSSSTTRTPRRPPRRRRRTAGSHTGDAGFFDQSGHLQDHRPRQGRGQAHQRRAVRAEIHREQAEVLPQHQGGGGFRRTGATSSPASSTSISRGRQLGRAQQRGLRLLSGACRPPAGLRDDRESTSRR